MMNGLFVINFYPTIFYAWYTLHICEINNYSNLHLLYLIIKNRFK
jgi:hypothetical protein